MRTCQSCKGIHQSSHIGAKCLRCEEILNVQLCRCCKEWLPAENFTMRKTKGHGIFRSYCRACERLRRRKHEKARPDLAKAAANRAQAKIRQALKDKYEIILETNSVAFKPLSEPQWIETCQYFDGCAICGAPNIEARSFFIPFEQGGKYAVWNIFPVCGTCGIKIRIYYNPLKWVKGMQAKTMGINKERAKKLVDFMMDQLEKVEK